MGIQLTKNFTLEEMTYSDTAKLRKIRNEIHDPERVIPNLKSLCTHVLQPTRDFFGPLVVTSGYSNVELSYALGRKLTSQHYSGQAADIISRKYKNYDIARWISRNLSFDQLIYEVRKRYPSGKLYDWVHVSYRNDGKNRKEILYSPATGGYLRGLPKENDV